MTEEKIVQLLDSASMIALLSRVITVAKVTHFDNIKSPVINNHARRIKESAEAIQRELAYNFKMKMKTEHVEDISLELYDVINFFQVLKPGEIEKIMSELKTKHE